MLRWLKFDGVKAMTAGPSRLEFGQAKLRVIVSAIILAYVAWYVGRDGAVTGDEVQALAAASAFFAFAVAITSESCKRQA